MQKVGLRTVVYGFGEMLHAELIAPGIIDDHPALMLAEIQVGIVCVDRLRNALPIGLGKVRVCDHAVVGSCTQYGIQRTKLPANEVLRARHVRLEAETAAAAAVFVTLADRLQVEQVVPAVLVAECGAAV